MLDSHPFCLLSQSHFDTCTQLERVRENKYVKNCATNKRWGWASIKYSWSRWKWERTQCVIVRKGASNKMSVWYFAYILLAYLFASSLFRECDSVGVHWIYSRLNQHNVIWCNENKQSTGEISNDRKLNKKGRKNRKPTNIVPGICKIKRNLFIEVNVCFAGLYAFFSLLFWCTWVARAPVCTRYTWKNQYFYSFDQISLCMFSDAIRFVAWHEIFCSHVWIRFESIRFVFFFVFFFEFVSNPRYWIGLEFLLRTFEVARPKIRRCQ